MGRFDDKEKKLDEENSSYDTTTEVFFDDTDERRLTNDVVCVIEFQDEVLGRGFSIQIPFSNIWMPEEMFRRVAVGVENAMGKLRAEDLEKSQIPCSQCGLVKSLNKTCRCPENQDHDCSNECSKCGECIGVKK